MNKVLQLIIRGRDATANAFNSALRNIRALRRSVVEFGKDIAVFGGSIGGAITGLGLLAKRGGEVLNVQRAFHRAAGDSAAALQQLREATGGLVSDMELMTGFNRAIALGSAQNVDDFARMARAAQALSLSLGIDVGYALESLNTGIARQSKQWLDNLGIIIDVDQANQQYAATLGKTVQQLTEAEKREAFRLAALKEADRLARQLGRGTDTAADTVGRLWTRLQNLRDAVAQMVAQSPAVEQFFGAIIQALDKLEEKLPGIIDRLSRLGTVFLDRLGLGDPVARETEIRLRRIRSTEGYGLERAQRLERQLTETINAAIIRRGELEREARRRRILEPDGSISLAVIGPGNDPEAMRIARELTDVRTELDIMFRVIAGIRDDIKRFRAQLKAGTKDAQGAADAIAEELRPAEFLAARGRLFRPFELVMRQAFREQVVGAELPPDFLRAIRPSGMGAPFGQFAITPGQVDEFFAPFVGRLWEFGDPVKQAEEAKRAAEKAKKEQERLDEEHRRRMLETQEIVVASFGAMAQAAIEGSRVTADSVVSMITDIVRSIPGVSSFAGAVIGAVGGVIGALLRSSRREPQPVRVVDVDRAAAEKLQPRREGPDVVTPIFVDAVTGRRIEEVEYQLGRRSRTDATPRYVDRR